jgi:D-amino-acid dehydrogenase
VSASLLSAEVAVVGGGAVGVAAALELARAGHDVLLIERGAAVGAGASAGTACLVTPSHAERLANPAALREGLRFLLDPAGPLVVRPSLKVAPWLARFAAAAVQSRAARSGTDALRDHCIISTRLHRDWAASADTGLIADGVLNAWATEEGLAHRDQWVAEHRAAGIPVEVLNGAEVRDREPLIRSAAGGSFYPDDAHVDSLVFTERVAAAAAAAGARIQTGVDVLAISTGSSLRLETTAGRVSAERVVIAAGVWSARFGRALGCRLPMIAAKGYHVEHVGAGALPARPVFLAEARVVATPLAGRLRLAGTLEFGGDPDGVDMRRIAAIVAAGADRLTGLEGREPDRIWRGLRPVTVDGMPIVGRSPRDPRIVIATGHAMLGLTMAPITATWVAGLVAGQDLDTELAPYGPGRFRW